MSLYPDDPRQKDRTRSRSRSRDHRSKDSSSPERPPHGESRESSYIYPEDDLDERYNRPGDPQASGALPYPEEGGIYSMLPGNQSLYSYENQQPAYHTVSPTPDAFYRSSRDKVDTNVPGAFPVDQRPQEDDKFKFFPQKYSRTYAPEDNGRSSDRDQDKDRKDKDRYDVDLAYGKPPVPPRPAPRTDDLAYGKASGISSTASQAMNTYSSYPPRQPSRQEPYPPYAPHDDDPYRRHAASSSVDEYGRRPMANTPEVGPYAANPNASANVLTVDPGGRERDRSRDRREGKSSGPRGSSDLLAVDSSSHKREKSRERSRSRRKEKSPSRDTLGVERHHRDRSRSRDGRRSKRDKSPQPPTDKMSSLTVGTAALAGASLANAPGSPMLESYYGTYQDCSPMPSPLLLASGNPADDARALEALSPIGSDNEGDSRRRRRARFHDPQDITTQLATALKGSRSPDTGPLIDILPSLTHDQVMELRTEYKRIVKTGSERKGVNIAKHIRSRLKDEDASLMKACYAVTLGMWESEAYWANFWYQGDKTRRELLIEALMGRSNGEIHYIKEAFTDKKYGNSLVKCMETELKEDKFKKAVLLVLDERRMEEYDHYGRQLPLDYQLVDQDVADLRKAIKSEKGGETAMIKIVVQRSDPHLRAILQEYEHSYRANFARDALKKSGNLVVSNPSPTHNHITHHSDMFSTG